MFSGVSFGAAGRALAEATCFEPARRDPVLDEEVPHRFGAALGELLVVGRFAVRVGVAVDAHAQVRVLLEDRKAIRQEPLAVLGAITALSWSKSRCAATQQPRASARTPFGVLGHSSLSSMTPSPSESVGGAAATWTGPRYTSRWNASIAAAA